MLLTYPFAFFWYTFWCLTYMLDDDIEAAGTYTSLVFSTITSISWPILYMLNLNPMGLLKVAFGYFWWDLVICLMFVDIFGWTMVFHAIVSLFGSYVSFTYPQHAFVFLTFEFSTIWLNLIRLKILRKYEWIFVLLFSISFILIRTCIGTYYTLMYIIPTTPLYVSLLACTLNSLNYFWTYRIVRKFL